ncbi:phosphotransferase [Dactylosporangium sp. McL0621]|uniref:phosphotransferase n=1 Tax=Dactylosporangium sp. McL0621 TaxID=3415678 RepID=UPI003CEE083D
MQIWTEEPLAGGAGAATGAVTRLTGRVRGRPVALIRKEFRPVTTGRHAAAAQDLRHWAYWRREALAYASGLLPAGPGLRAPRCYGIAGDVVYLEDAGAAPESAAVAARRLARWQSAAPVPDRPWLAGDQLVQRLAVTDLDWRAVRADPRLAALWARRGELLAVRAAVPRVLSHGDFHLGQLRAVGDTTVVLDWATLGLGPVGADLAQLALSTLRDPVPDYLSGSRFAPAAVRTGYATTLALTGASRVHWMLSAGVPVPAGYQEFVVAQVCTMQPQPS